MTFLAVETQPELQDDIPAVHTTGLVPFTQNALPPLVDLSGWTSMLQFGSRVPVFDSATLINPPVNPSDAVSLQFLGNIIGVFVPSGGDIQAAVNALPATGGVVTLAEGALYVVNTQITVTKPDVTIQGASWNTIVRRGPTMPPSSSIIAASSTALRFTLRNITLDGNSPVNVYTNGSFELGVGGVDSVVQGCQIIGMGGAGAIALSGMGTRAINNRIRGRASTTLNIGNYGIWATSHAKVTISQNFITGTAIAGIVFDGPGTQVTGNYLANCQCAAGTPDGTGGAGQIVHLGGFPGALLEANYIDTGGGPQSYGISLSGTDISIIGNSVIGQKQYGILITSVVSSGILMTGNTVINSGQAGTPVPGLFISGGISNLVIAGNRFADSQTTHTQSWGIFFSATAAFSRVSVTGNDLTGNITGALSPPSAATTEFLASNNLGAANLPGVPPTNALNDAAAQAAGVAIGGQYRNGSVLMVRVV